MKKGKRIKRWGSLLLAFATVTSGITVSAPLSANAAGDLPVSWMPSIVQKQMEILSISALTGNL